MSTPRRAFLKNAAAAAFGAAVPVLGFTQTADSRSLFAPQSGQWRTLEVTTRVDIARTEGATRVWLPIPSVDSDYQHSQESSFSSNGTVRFMRGGEEGVKMLYAEFAADQARPFVKLTNRVQTQNRAVDWTRRNARAEDADMLRYFTRATTLIPTDGIVRETPAVPRRARAPTLRRPKCCTTGSSATPTANPRCAAVVKATSRACLKQKTWVASAPT